METQNNFTWLGFPITDSDDAARARFLARFGYPAQTIIIAGPIKLVGPLAPTPANPASAPLAPSPSNLQTRLPL